MPHPSSLAQLYSFKEWASTNPSAPLPGQKVDQEFASVRGGVNALIERLKLIQDDDGKLGRGTVSLDQLRGGLIDALLLRLVERVEAQTGRVLRLVFVQGFVGDGATSSYTLSRPIPSARQAVVTVAGAVQTEGGFLASGTTLTLPAPVPLGQIVEIRYFDGNIPIDRFEGDGVTSSFTMSRALPDAPWGWVSVSGVTQHVEAYSVQGNKLLFVAPPPPDVPIEVRFFWEIPMPAALILEAECCEC